VREYLPRGNLLDDAAFRRRHLLLSWILGLHIPALFAFGVSQGYGVEHSALEVALPAALLLFGQLARQRRLKAFFVTAGLVFCSTVIVHLSGGMIEAHFHFFILIGLIALYEDWVPFVWNVVFVVVSHGLGNTFAADLMYNHSAAQNKPWTWALIHGVSVLAACAGVIIFWRNVEQEKERSEALASELGDAELAAVQAEAARRRTVSQLYVNLARRNQSLLDRQLNLITALEQQEREPDVLGDLFQLDHLATRMRRNAESLLVLSGAEPARLWRQAVPLADVVRAAAAEVEQYQRVDVHVSDHLMVAGRNVADLAHLLAELIENATTFSPPGSEVRVRSHPTPNADAPYLVSIEDVGIGMSQDDLDAANAILSDPPDLDAENSRLGFHVVGRLARRLGLRVSVAPTPAGGTTALVTLPHELAGDDQLADEEPAVPATAFMAGGAPRANGVSNGVAADDAPVPALNRPPVEVMPPPPPPRPSWAAPGVARPAAPPVAPAAPATTVGAPGGNGAGAGSSDGLPQRVPGANLAPGLRTTNGAPQANGNGNGAGDLSGAAEGRGDAHSYGDTRPNGNDGQGNGNGATPAAGAGPAEPGAGEGLARRVPGANLAPGLRRSPQGDGDGADEPPAAERDARAGTMLSRFQASQRAGRAAASAEPNGDEHHDPSGEQEQ
jgi:signal transduction histidine kinase